MQNEFNIANVSIDRTRPKIELISIQNSDENFKNYDRAGDNRCNVEI